MPAELRDKPSLAIVTIATNQYVHYWTAMAITMDKYVTEKNDVTFHVFTDHPNIAETLEPELRNSKLQIEEVPSWKWPEVALKRYEVIYNAIPKIASDFLMYIDADMLAHSEIPDIRELLDTRSIALTAHPGFWRPNTKSLLTLYLIKPLIAIRDFRMRLKTGGLGAWETNVKSSAFVPREKRSKYVCGGFWLGEKNSIRKLSEELMKQTSLDCDSSTEAIWLDESHLNKWASQNPQKFALLKPEYCYDPTYPQLKTLEIIIEAVNKTKNPIVSSHG